MAARLEVPSLPVCACSEIEMHKVMEQNSKIRDLNILHCLEVTIGGLLLEKHWRWNLMLRHHTPQLSLSQATDGDGLPMGAS